MSWFNAHHEIESHIPRLRRYARALTGDAMRADDLVQDTLERAWSKFALWRRGSDLRAWLFTLMHNVYVNQITQAKARPEWLTLDEDMPELPVEAQQEAALEVRDLVTALTQLPPDYREVLLLVALEDMRYEDAAKVLGIPIGTVMSRLARARERVRHLMAGETAPVLRRVK